MFGPCIVVQYFVSFLVLQSSRWEREGWLHNFKFSSGCYVAVIVLCLFLTVPWVSLWCVIIAFPCHTHLFVFLFHLS